MKPLTVYIMSCDVPEADLPLGTIQDSVGDVVEKYVLLNHRNLAEFVKGCKTDWYMYLFSNEHLSEDLTKVLPILLESQFDVWVMFERQKHEGEYKYGFSPRLFKSNIALKGMIPLTDEGILIERALDGFIEQG